MPGKAHRADASKAAWSRARELAELQGIPLKQARSELAKNPAAFDGGQGGCRQFRRPRQVVALPKIATEGRPQLGGIGAATPGKVPTHG